MVQKLPYKSRMLFYFSVLILLLVTCSGVVNYLNGRRLVAENARLHTTDTLIQLKNTNDLLLANMEQTLQGITSYSNLELFAVRYSSIKDYREKSAVFTRVSAVLNLNEYFTSCYVYYPEQRTVIDVNARTPVYESVNENRNQQMITAVYDAYKKRVGIDGNPLFSVVKAGGGIEWIMAVPIQDSFQAAEPPLLMVTVDSSYFFRSLSTLDLAEGSRVYISAGDGSWIDREPAQSLQNTFAERAAHAPAGDFTQTLDGVKYLAAYTMSETLGWKYICTVPLQMVYSQVQFLAVAAVVAALLCCLIGMVLVKTITGKLYTPIENLSGKLRSAGADEPPVGGDALDALHTGVSDLISRNRQLQDRLAENERTVKNVFLFQLLRSDIEPESSIYERFALYQIPFTNQMRYQVTVLSLEQGGPSRRTYESRQALWAKLLEFEQALKEAFAPLSHFHLETVNMEEHDLCIIIGLENETYTEQDMAALFATLQQDAQERLCCPVTLGFSMLAADAAKLPLLYEQARTALEHQFFLGVSRAIGYGELPEKVAQTYCYPWDIEKTLLSNLRQGQLEPVYQSVEEFAGYVSSHVRDAERSRMAFLHLCTDLARAAEDFMPVGTEGALRDGLQRSVLASSRSSDIVEQLKSYCAVLCAEVSKRRDDHTNDIAKSALDFLEKHYAEPQIDMDVLSGELGFSTSYVSKMFKASTGESIKEYITRRRIALACDMLHTTRKKVWEISQAVGYDQQRSFIEIFKKYKGMTPSEYRNRQKGEP